MTVILDTSVPGELRLRSPDQNVVSWVGEQAEQDLAHSVIAAIAVANNATITTRNRYDLALIVRNRPALSGVDPWTGQKFRSSVAVAGTHRVPGFTSPRDQPNTGR